MTYNLQKEFNRR